MPRRYIQIKKYTAEKSAISRRKNGQERMGGTEARNESLNNAANLSSKIQTFPSQLKLGGIRQKGWQNHKEKQETDGELFTS